MNLRRINYHCSCGSCDECTGGNALSYFEGMTQVPNIEQIVPIPGPAGEGSVLTAGKTSSAGVLNADGADEALDSTAKTNLAAADFDIEVKSTTQNVVDTADLNNNKIWTGLSKGFLNLIGLKILPKLLPNFGTSGNIVRDNGTAWVSVAPDWEKYNSVTTTSQAFNEASTSLIDTTVVFVVGTGYSYRFKNVVAIVDTVSPLSNYVEGIVEAYSAGNLTVRIKNVKGSGNTLNYNVMLTAPEYLPFVKDPANYGKFFYNNSGVIEMRTSIESVGDTKIVLRPAALDPEGWIAFDGVPRTETEFPALYEYLNYIGSSFISGSNFTLPNMAGRALVGVDSGDVDFDVIGDFIGQTTRILSDENLPEVSPYPITGFSLVGNAFNASCVEGSGRVVFAQDNGGGGGGATTMPISGTITAGTNTSTGGTAFDQRQKSMAIRMIIKAV